MAAGPLVHWSDDEELALTQAALWSAGRIQAGYADLRRRFPAVF